MDKHLYDGSVKMFVHDDGMIEIYTVCNCQVTRRHFISIENFSEILAKARSFMAGITKP